VLASPVCARVTVIFSVRDFVTRSVRGEVVTNAGLRRGRRRTFRILWPRTDGPGHRASGDDAHVFSHGVFSFSFRTICCCCSKTPKKKRRITRRRRNTKTFRRHLLARSDKTAANRSY